MGEEPDWDGEWDRDLGQSTWPTGEPFVPLEG